MIVVDPVCGMELNQEDVRYVTEYRGQTYYFDSAECQQLFEEDPNAYAGGIPEKIYDLHGQRVDGSE